MIRSLVFAALVLLAGCAKSEKAALVPIDEDEGFNVVAPVKASAVEEPALSLGEWTQGMQEDQPALLFGPAGTEPLFSMRCDDRGGLLLQRHGVVPTGAAEMMTLSFDGTSQRLAVNPVAGTVPKLRAAIPASDDLLAALGGASTPLTVALGDGPALNLPADPAIGNFIRSCAGTGARAAAGDSSGNAAAAPAR